MGIMKHITKEDAVDVVNGDEILEERAKKNGKVLKVKKRNIINKLNEKLSTIRVSPQRNEMERNYSSLNDYQMLASRRTAAENETSLGRRGNENSPVTFSLDMKQLGNELKTPTAMYGNQQLSF